MHANATEHFVLIMWRNEVGVVPGVSQCAALFVKDACIEGMMGRCEMYNTFHSGSDS